MGAFFQRMKDQKGFALIISLFLVVTMTTIAAGSVLSLGRQQRAAQQTADRIRLHWVAEGIIDQGMRLFSDYVRSAGFPPHDGTSSEVYDDRESNAEFKTKLSTWATTFAARRDIPVLFQSVQVLSASVTYRSTNLAGTTRRYRLAIRLRDTRSEAEVSVSQELDISAGQLFDYGAFSNLDMEILSGPSWTVQGPIYSRGDIYLMNDTGSTLTLKASDGGDSNYILWSYGNIYYYFKTAIGKNYLLENDDYFAVVPEFYKTAETRNSVEIAPQPDYKRNGIPPPYQYIFWNGNKTANPHTIKVVEANGDSENLLDDTTATALRVGVWESYAYEPYTPTLTGPYSVAAFSQYGTTTYANAPSNTATGNYLSVSTAVGSNSPYTERKLDPDWDETNQVEVQDQPDEKPFPNPQWNGYPKEGSSLSSKLIADSKQGVPLLSLPVGGSGSGGNAHLLIEPWYSRYCDLGATCQDEDLKGGVPDRNDVLLAGQKLERFANVFYGCSNAACASFVVKAAPAPTSAGPVSLSLTSDGSGGGFPVGLYPGSSSIASYKYVYDYRIGKALKTLVIDVGALVTFAEQHRADAAEEMLGYATGRTDIGNAMVLYIQTRSSKKSSAYNAVLPEMVKLINGARLPKGGLSVITNGRLWVQGDYNIIPYNENIPGIACTTSALKDGSCQPPPSDIYCDSFGVLSSGWTNEAPSLPVATKALTARLANADMILNAAVITGQVPSQLAKPTGRLRNSPPAPAYMDLSAITATTALKGAANTAYKVLTPDYLFNAFAADDGTGKYFLTQAYLNRDANSPGSQKWYQEKILDNPGYQRLNSANTDYYSSTLSQMWMNFTFERYKRVCTAFADSSCDSYALYQTVYSGMNAQSRGVGNSPPQWYMEHTGVDTSWNAKANIVPTIDAVTGAPVSDRWFWRAATAAAEEKPNASAPYPGIRFRWLNKSVLERLQYTCVKKRIYIEKYNDYGTQRVCDETAPSEGRPCKGPGLVYVTGTDTYSACKCDGLDHDGDNLTAPLNFSRTDGGYIHGNNYGGATGAFRWPLGWADTDGDGKPGEKNEPANTPSVAQTAAFAGTNLCPDEADNYYQVYPGVYYSGGYYAPLWDAKYSGGFENIINLQESWSGRGLFFSGTLVSAWNSVDLLKDITQPTKPAFYGWTYYNPPTRDYDFNERLRETPPPLSARSGLSIYSIRRRNFKEIWTS